MTAKEVYMKMKYLAQTLPDLENIEFTTETYEWLGEFQSLMDSLSGLGNDVSLNFAINTLTSNPKSNDRLRLGQGAARKIKTIFYNALATAKQNAPDSMQESFILVGKSFDFFSAMAGIFDKAKKDVLIVDPYLDHTIFTKFAYLIEEQINVRLLASKNKQALQPAFEAWVKQYGSTRPVELRIAPKLRLHDRLVIVDNKALWILSQSLHYFAERAEGNIMPSQEPELKVECYNDLWDKSKPIKP